MKPFTVSEITSKGYNRASAMPSFIRSSGLSIRDRKNREHLFSDKIAEMILKVDQGHWDGIIQLIGNVSRTISGL